MMGFLYFIILVTIGIIISKVSYRLGVEATLRWIMKRGMFHYGNDFLTDMNELSTEIRIELGELDERGHVVK